MENRAAVKWNKKISMENVNFIEAEGRITAQGLVGVARKGCRNRCAPFFSVVSCIRLQCGRPGAHRHHGATARRLPYSPRRGP